MCWSVWASRPRLSEAFESLPTTLIISLIQMGPVLTAVWKTNRADQGFVGIIKNGDVVFLHRRQKNYERQDLENVGKRGRDRCSCKWT